MNRYLKDNIIKDLKTKMVFLIGPRQVGKTYLAKNLMEDFTKPIYLNYDDINDNKMIRNGKWTADTGLIILDEIHKMKGWKNYLKGIYDTKGSTQKILVTGSARLDAFRRTGESLAGRYFSLRLNPLSVKELAWNMKPYDALNLLNRLGGFPEPFLSGSDEHAARWRTQYFTDIVREDILDFSRIHEVRAIRVLLEMLRKRVGSPVSYSSLSEDIQLSPNTIRKYLDILESLHIIFTVRPYHRNVARAILKEPKVYFYDTGYVDADEGIKLENTAAVCLLKSCQYMQDTKGAADALHYIRTKEGKETDFVIAGDRGIKQLIEIKLSDDGVDPNLKYFSEKHPEADSIQLVHNARHDRQEGKVSILKAGEWLAGLEA